MASDIAQEAQDYLEGRWHEPIDSSHDYIKFADLNGAEWIDTDPWVHRVTAHGFMFPRQQLPMGGAHIIAPATFDLGSYLSHASLRISGLRLVSLAGFMGVIPITQVPNLETAIPDAIKRLSEVGIGRDVAELLRGPSASLEDWSRGLSALMTSLEDSPLPIPEWNSIEQILGIDELSQMTRPGAQGTGIDSMTDREIARLHALTRIVADLRSAYNEFGIKRWFARPRPQLDGRSPSEMLRGDWNPDDEDPIAVRKLAESLLGFQAT